MQALEDALCLVFLETQLADVVARLDPDTLTRVIVRTAKKMSKAGRAAIADVPLDEHAVTMLVTAVARDVVDRYLAGLAAHDWTAVAATLAPDVDTHGPVPRRVPRTRARTRRSCVTRSPRSAVTGSTSTACSAPARW